MHSQRAQGCFASMCGNSHYLLALEYPFGGMGKRQVDTGTALFYIGEVKDRYFTVVRSDSQMQI